jgi:hypothetical protein
MFMARSKAPNLTKDALAFAVMVRAAQHDMGLVEDGKLGPLTLTAIQATHVGPVPSFTHPEHSEPHLRSMVAQGQAYRTEFDVYKGAPFASRLRRTAPHQVVIHESVTNDPDILDEDDTTERILRRKKCGVHVMIGPDATTIQHNDLVNGMPCHAGQQNRSSVGIEIVGPYYKTRRPHWTRLITAKWADKKRYAVPPIAQMRRLVEVLEWLTQCPRLDVPRTFVGAMADGRFLMGRHPDGRRIIRTGRGIWAHGYTAHADGFFPALYAYLVMAGGMDTSDAYDLAIAVASTAGQRAVIH